ncbi:RNA-splicing ligase protein [Rhizobium phage RHph_N1_15]|nr:RNA-splicing ligase protein [Rhizobium phage RHph_N1_15]QIG75198.1 RNA-splicing ligase protein [Rhizobium phage RHph_N2_6]
MSWGLEPGAWFKDALPVANQMRTEGKTDRQIIDHLFTLRVMPAVVDDVPLRTNSIPFGRFIEPESDDEILNTASVVAHMDALLRTPTIVKGAVMPDACPSGSAMGTIPVGGVVATKDAIHPGFHSADICCSVAMSIFKRDDAVGKVMTAAMKATHFGPGGRPDSKDVPRQFAEILDKIVSGFKGNRFLAGLEEIAIDHFMTQGDGNHFLYVGEVESSGKMAIVTHHGSRGLGAQLYKRGKRVAEKHTRIVAPRVPLHNAWIDANSEDGKAYWEALQVIRVWTKMNHFALHHLISMYLGNSIEAQMWNEHNFVFQRADGLYYHAKGATPSFSGFANDDHGATLIPLNMAQPILVARHANNEDALGFAPHGAGRNLSRTAHLKRLAAAYGSDDRGLSPRDVSAQMVKETGGLDVRFYTGFADPSEFPSAYKSADQVQSQIRKFGLAEITDRILPRGSIMAGEMKWHREKKKPKVAAAV